MRTSLILALAAGSVVASGVALSLQVTPSTSSHPSTIADEATTVSKVDRVAVVAAEPPQETMPAAVQAPSFEVSRTDFLLSPSTQASQPAFYEVAEEASEDRTALEITSGPPPFVVAARAEQPIDQTASDQPAPAPKSTKQKSAKTTAKKPVSRDGVTKEQHHAKAVVAPETKDEVVANNQEPTTSDMQEAPNAGAFPNPISKLRELFARQ
jgi:hypothetical protein